MVEKDLSGPCRQPAALSPGAINAGYLESQHFGPSVLGRAWLRKWVIAEGNYLADLEADS